tara:strand:+ start:1382 stop:1897 length:516 start_codon:yes stop_codon:yes gene_type:complete
MSKLLNDNIQEPEYNPFDAPIPGQSLTDEPGNYPWEHAPKTTTPEDALDKFWDRLTDPEVAEEMITMMEAGVPVEALARILTFTGFAEGEFTPDVGFLIAEPLMKMLAAIGIRAGVNKLVISIGELDENNNTVRDMLTLKEANEKIEEVVEQQPALPAKQGLMSKPEVKEE